MPSTTSCPACARRPRRFGAPAAERPCWRPARPLRSTRTTRRPSARSFLPRPCTSCSTSAWVASAACAAEGRTRAGWRRRLPSEWSACAGRMTSTRCGRRTHPTTVTRRARRRSSARSACSATWSSRTSARASRRSCWRRRTSAWRRSKPGQYHQWRGLERARRTRAPTCTGTSTRMSRRCGSAALSMGLPRPGSAATSAATASVACTACSGAAARPRLRSAQSSCGVGWAMPALRPSAASSSARA
mmetsp:Transcript_137805/g.384241  ORF Transcript_137805/g.384241 Transcript_137805/m.384241 type:complete len:246 (-) Transcript_137805:603-1340(-)